MPEQRPEFTLDATMIERAARAAEAAVDSGDASWEHVAEAALRAAFEGVPTINYGIGLLLQFFDIVIGIKDRDLKSAAGVYRLNGNPDEFDSLGHTIDLSWGHDPHYIKRVAIGKIDPPKVDAPPEATK